MSSKKKSNKSLDFTIVEGNPAPTGGTVSWADCGDGIDIRTAYWPVPKDVTFKGSVLFVGGRTEYIEKYFESYQQLLDRGYSVAAFDWRGQGLSTRECDDHDMGHIDDFDDYLEDFTKVYETVLKDKMVGPRHMIAHSMGGLNAIGFVHDHPDVFASLILSGPMVGIEVPKPQMMILAVLARLRGLFVSNKTYALGAGPYDEDNVKFDNNGLTHDQTRFDINVALNDANKDLRLGGITFGWALAALKSMKMINKKSYIDEIKLPILCCVGKKDFVVSQQQVAIWADNCKNCRLEELDGCAHEILRETDEVQKKFWSFFDEHITQF